MARKPRTLSVATLLSDDDMQAESQLTEMQEQAAADAYAASIDLSDDDEAESEQFADAITNLVLDGPPAPPKRNRIEEISAAAERKAREIPIVDRLGKKPSAEKVIKAQTPKPVKEPKAPKELPLCQCGCGERTGGGRFLPGHDAKLKSRLFIEARSETDTVRVNALQQLEERNWLHLMGDKKAPKVKASTELTEADRLQRILDDLTYFGIGVVERNEIMVMVEKAIDAEPSDEATA